MVSSGGGALMTTSARQSSLSSAWKFETLELERRRKRCSTAETIQIQPFKNSLEHQRLVLASRRSFVVSQAFNLRVSAAASKQVASKGRSGKDSTKSEPEVAQINGQNPKQSNKKSFSEASSTGATTTGQGQVIKDGFAGLSGLKIQLEKERHRVSRVNVNDIGVGGQKQAEIQRKRQTVVHSKTPPGGIADARNPRSKEVQIRRGNSTLILVKNLAKQVTEEDYRRVMQSIPEIKNWKYLSDKEGLCSGYSFCELHAGGDVTTIIQTLSVQVLHGEKIEASLSEKSGEYNNQSSERQVRQNLGKKDSSWSSSVQGRLEKGNPDVSDQAHLLDVSEVVPKSVERDDATQVESASSQGHEELKNRKRYVEEEQQNTSRSPTVFVDRGATDVGSSRSWDSSQGNESVDDDGGKLTGSSVLEAFHRAAALRKSRAKPRRQKGRSGSGKSGSDSDSEGEDQSSQQDPLPPFVFKSEWATRIEELETDMKILRQLL